VIVINIVGVGKVDVLEYTSTPQRRVLVQLDAYQPFVIWYLTPAEHAVYGDNAFYADTGHYFSNLVDAMTKWRSISSV
jgi:hypothetical protein